MVIFIVIVTSLLVSFFYILNQKSVCSKQLNLPPGPPKLPIIGNIHQIIGSLPQHAFCDLAKKYGPIMHLQLGSISTIIISSPRLTEQVMKTNDLALANRPYALIYDIVIYGSSDVALGSYGGYWRQMKKIITVELLSQQKVKSFSHVRQQEVGRFVEFIRSTCGKPINMHEKLMKLSNNNICKSLFGDSCKQQDVFIQLLEQVMKLGSSLYLSDLFPEFTFLSIISGMKSKLTKIHKNLDKIFDDIFDERRIKRQTKGASEEDLLDVLFNVKERGGHQFPITDNNIKAILMDMFLGGTDTSAVTIEWAMTELIRKPDVMNKAQIEVREAFKGKKRITETDLQDLVYLKHIIKETLRLHIPPILIPRECREQCQIDGYDIPVKTKVIINAFACATDPNYWDDGESFRPERFEKCSVNFYGTNYEFVPFGGGRRICPGINFGLIFIELTLAEMLYYFNWQLPCGLSPKDIDMSENYGAIASKKVPLQLIPTLYSPVS